MAELKSGKRICDEQLRWSELPSLALERIYSFLDGSDRATMSLVCRNWSQEFYSPTLLKTYHFVIRDKRRNMKLVQKCSRIFKHVQIIYNPYMKGEVLSAWIEDFKIFLHMLSNSSQLDSVRFIDDRYSSDPNAEQRAYLNVPIYEDMCEAIANFLGSQRQLKRLEFQKMPFKYKDAVEFLKKASENSKESLKTLAIPYFIPKLYGERDSVDEQLLNTIFGFWNLSFLEIDYWLIFSNKKAILSDIIEKLRNCRKQTILRIRALIENRKDSEEIKLLKSSDWRYLKQKFPHLEVELKVGGRRRTLSQPPECFIVECMPVTRLECYFHDSYPMEIDAFLKHLLDCKMSDSLVFFLLRWDRPISNLASTFVPFLNACKKLKTLEVLTGFPPNHLDDLLLSLLVNRHESLRKLKLKNLRASTVNDIKAVLRLASQFEPHLQLLNVKLVIDAYDF